MTTKKPFSLGRSAVAAALAFHAVVGTARPAHAQAAAEQRAAAQALFDDARRLIAEQRWADACPKLEESNHLDPGIGTLLNLAECQSQIGKTASAWANFLEAAYQAKAAGQSKREATARARAAALEPKLSRLTILAVAGATTLEIKRDGSPVAPSLVGTAVPVDPGNHTVTASAPGKKPWTTTVAVRADAHQVTVSVPQLEDGEAVVAPLPPPGQLPVKPPPGPDAKALPVPPVEPAQSGPPPNTDTGRGPRAAGAVLLVLGIGGLAAGTGLTVVAKQKVDASNSQGCNAKTNVCTNQGAYNLRNQARSFGNGATGAWVGGGVATAAGISLLVVASVIKSKEVAVAPTLLVDGRSVGLGAAGRFE